MAPLRVSAPIGCFVADDSEPVREALRSLLEAEGVNVLGCAPGGLELLLLLEQLPTTVIVLDLKLPDLNGIEVARRAAEIVRRKTAIVVYTSSTDPGLVAVGLDAGARTVVVKGASPANLLDAIGAVAGGAIYVDPELRAGTALRHT